MKPPVTLDHTVMHVSDWDSATAFWRDVMGADIVPTPKGAVVFRFGNAQLNLHGPGAIGSPVARVPVQPGNSDVCFEWHGPIEDAQSHLATHGVEIELGPVERFGLKGQGASLYFRDPDGTLCEFISYVDDAPSGQS